MNGGSLIRSWPAGLVLVASAGLALAAGHGSARSAAMRGTYPVRIALLEPGAPVAESPATPSAEEPQAAPTPAEMPPPPDFAAAFEEFSGEPAVPAPPRGQQLAPAAATVAAKPDPGMLAVRFDLSDPFAPGAKDSGPIQLTKAVKVNGADAGNATIRVTDGATIAIAGEDLGHLLADAGRGDLAAALGGRFVTFDRIRRAGLGVRYDAASDRILLTS